MRVLLIIIICILLALVFKKRMSWSCIVSAILLGLIAYSISDTGQEDYVIHKTVYDHVQKGGFESIATHYYFLTSPLYVFYVYLLSFFQDNRMLSVINTFLCYLNVFTVMLVAFKRTNGSSRNLLKCFIYLICVLPWVDFSLGIRGGYAFSLCALAFLYDSSPGRYRLLSLLFFIIPIFIHQACSAILLIWLMALFVNKFKGIRRIAFFVVFLTGLMSASLTLLGDSLSSIPGLQFISVVTHSLDEYAVKQDGGAGVYGTGIVIIRGLGMLIPFVLLLSQYKRSKKNINGDGLMVWDVPSISFSLMMFFTMGYVWQFDMFARYSVACIMLTPFIFSKQKRIPVYVVLFALMALIYNTWNNYSYVFFE